MKFALAIIEGKRNWATFNSTQLVTLDTEVSKGCYYYEVKK